MVFQPHQQQRVLDVRVCNLSLHRHETSVQLLKRNRGMAGNGPERHQALPQVELRPFAKQVWRREKSLPDFYDKRQLPEAKTGSKEKPLELSPMTHSLVKEIEASREATEIRHGTAMDSSFGKVRSHPKAEFLHESSKTWRTQDFIPSFITRFERTKTSMESVHKNDITDFRLSFEPQSVHGHHSSGQQFPGSMNISGGRMNPRIYKRQLLYLNPLDSYRQSNSLASTARDVDQLTRHTFPMASSRSKDFRLGGSTFSNYPLRPIRQEHAPSPHKFNSKLGAAKSALQILGKWGIPTKLEVNLQKEFEMNLERFRRDRVVLPADLFNVSQPPTLETHLTRGELLLRQAREANRAKKRNLLSVKVSHQHDHTDGGDSGIQSPEEAESDSSPRLEDTFVDVSKHPIHHVLNEETESIAPTDVTQNEVRVNTNMTSQDDETLVKSHSSTRNDVMVSQTDHAQLVSNHNVPDIKTNDDVNFDASANPLGSNSTTCAEHQLNAKGRSRSAGAARPLQTPTEGEFWSPMFIPDQEILMDRSNIDNAGSLTARAKTNLEYLHNLRVKGGLPPLQPLDKQPLSSAQSDQLRPTSEQLPQRRVSAPEQIKPDDQINLSTDEHENHIDCTTVSEPAQATSSCDIPSPALNPKTIADNVPQSEATLKSSQGFDEPTSLERDEAVAAAEGNNSVDNSTILDSQTIVTDSTAAHENTPNTHDQNLDMGEIKNSCAETSDGSDGAEAPSTSFQNELIGFASKERSTTDVPSKIHGEVSDINESSEDVKDDERVAQSSEDVKDDERVAESSEDVKNDERIADTVTQDEPSDEGISLPNDKEMEGSCKLANSLGGAEEAETSYPNKELVLEKEDGKYSPISNPIGQNTTVADGEQGFLLPPSLTLGETEGESMTPSLTTSNLDTSLEPMSDADGVFSSSADNGDSGVSTTFLTTTDSQAQELVGYL